MESVLEASLPHRGHGVGSDGSALHEGNVGFNVIQEGPAIRRGRENHRHGGHEAEESKRGTHWDWLRRNGRGERRGERGRLGSRSGRCSEGDRVDGF